MVKKLNPIQFLGPSHPSAGPEVVLNTHVSGVDEEVEELEIVPDDEESSNKLAKD